MPGKTSMKRKRKKIKIIKKMKNEGKEEKIALSTYFFINQEERERKRGR